ncbi:hypothetical protein BDW74DRAFT_118757 [Aspergillus multicolor]|uniref:uncharacterized protein n=1 Tax=Aspergillus multicolor TaxID=41759 RepID=UPI003CCDB64C
MRMSRATTLLNLLLGLRTATATATSSFTNTLSKSQSPASHLFAQCHATNLYSYPYASLAKTSHNYSTMSAQNSNPEQPHPQNQEQDQSSEKKPILALPDASSASDTTQLDVNGDGVKLDHLGPLVVNTDGTLARIGNWAQMTEIEKRNTLRVLGKRNKERMEKLKAQGQALGQPQEGEKAE